MQMMMMTSPHAVNSVYPT